MAEEAHQNNVKWVENRPFYLKARLALADSSLRLAILNNDSNLADESIRLYQETTEMLPSSFPALNRLADALIVLGQPQRALESLERSLAMVENPKDSVTPLLLQAEAYQNLGLTPQVLESLGKAVEAGPQEAPPYYIRGGTYRLLGQLDLAIDDLSQAILLTHNYGMAYYIRALAYTELGREAEAEEDIEQAVKLGVDENSLMAANEELKESR